MKYYLLLPALLLSLAACSNPSLKWIGTPEDHDVGVSELFFGINDANLIDSSYGPPAGSPALTIAANPNAAGTGAPYSNPLWRLDGEPCEGPFTGKPYEITDPWTVTLRIDLLEPVVHVVQVTVTGVDGKSYTDQADVLAYE